MSLIFIPFPLTILNFQCLFDTCWLLRVRTDYLLKLVLFQIGLYHVLRPVTRRTARALATAHLDLTKHPAHMHGMINFRTITNQCQNICSLHISHYSCSEAMELIGDPMDHITRRPFNTNRPCQPTVRLYTQPFSTNAVHKVANPFCLQLCRSQTAGKCLVNVYSHGTPRPPLFPSPFLFCSPGSLNIWGGTT